VFVAGPVALTSQKHDARKESSLPSHVSRLSLDDFQLALVEPQAAAFSAGVDYHGVGYAPFDQVQTINRAFSRCFSARIDLRQAFLAKPVSQL
jgi:hypothetical protein